MTGVTRGGCLCGAVRYSLSKAPEAYGACHCGMCRRWTGGPAMAASVGAVHFDGEEHVGRYASSDWAERGFCIKCGTCLFYRLMEPDHYVLWVGAFDDPEPFALSGEIFVDEKPSGYEFAGDHPRLTAAEFMATLQEDS